MDAVTSQFQTALTSKRLLTKQILTTLIDSVEQTDLPKLYRSLFRRLNDHLLYVAHHNQPADVFIATRQLSWNLHENFLSKYSPSDSKTIKQLSQILKNLQQQKPLTQNELNQWKHSQQGLKSDDLILHCIFNNSPQLALSKEFSISLDEIFRVALHTCVQNLADRDNKTSTKILFALGLAPLDIVQRIMSTTVYDNLREYCAQYLKDSGEDISLNNQELDTLDDMSQLRKLYQSETVNDFISGVKTRDWNEVYPTTRSIKTFSCRDIVPNVKSTSQSTSSLKLIAYMQVAFDWMHTALENEDGHIKRWLLTIEGRQLTGEQIIFSVEGNIISYLTMKKNNYGY